MLFQFACFSRGHWSQLQLIDSVGRITRLTGRGAGNLSLNKHGPHFGSEPEEATVRAVVQLSDNDEPIEIRRRISEPNNLECDDAARQKLEPIFSLARRVQHVLTRREILKYVTAEGGTRATEIQQLLNITEIEETRKALVKVGHEFESNLAAAARARETARGAVNATVRRVSFEPAAVLDVVNTNRSELGAVPITILKASELKTNTTPPATTGNARSINVAVLEETDIQNLLDAASGPRRAEVAEIHRRLVELLAPIRTDPGLVRAVDRHKLVSLGIALLDESGDCPLCDIRWEHAKLLEHLQLKLDTAKEVSESLKQISSRANVMKERVNTLRASLETVTGALRLAQISEFDSALSEWQEALRTSTEALNDVVQAYPPARFEEARILRLFAPENIGELALNILNALKAKFPRSSPQQTAWDVLTRLEENLKGLETADSEYEIADIAGKRATRLLECFEKARDTVLRQLYDSVRDRFVSLYKHLHEPDEQGFDARLEPDGAALDFEVNFYGRGSHPPHALHSEGHQDSMGLCLYLALAERLTKGVIDLILLDDVVMSVDADHRRQLCRLLANEFKHRQFLITTHDRTWASQLKTEHVVAAKNTIEFFGWTVDSGPRHNARLDMWHRIDGDLTNDDVRAAAARLRHGSEEYFSGICDALHAPVRFRSDGRWELGDLLPAATGQYKELLKKAKQAANSWGNLEVVEKLKETDSVARQVFARLNSEYWAVNSAVHYNNWGNFTQNDFRPVVDTFRDLFGIFACSRCQGLLAVATEGPNDVNVRCDCGTVNWNLKKKGD